MGESNGLLLLIVTEPPANIEINILMYFERVLTADGIDNNYSSSNTIPSGLKTKRLDVSSMINDLTSHPWKWLTIKIT
jgi:hypothetical protein